MGKLFVTLFAFLPARNKFVLAVAPGHAHLQAIKTLHHDKFLAPRQIVHPSLAALARSRRDTRNAQ
jgi:hypothetical protein